MKVVWVGWPGDSEFDLTAAIAKQKDISLVWYWPFDRADQNNDFHHKQITISSQLKEVVIPMIDWQKRGEMFEAIKGENADLIVVRHPTWLPGEKLAHEMIDIMKGQPTVLWAQEMGPLRHQAMLLASQWPRIAVNNYVDMQVYKKELPKRKILYLPFGAVPWEAKDLVFQRQYQSDLVCDAQPHYDCEDFDGVKKVSINNLVVPLLDKNIGLWGNRYGEATEHDWNGVPYAEAKVKGTYPTMDYPKIYSSCKLYIGPSWNATFGGSSTRLTRALSTGIPVLWQKTMGMELEGFERGKHLNWSGTPSETKELVEYYMSHNNERIQMGLRGREWVLENWEWSKMLKRLVTEVKETV